MIRSRSYGKCIRMFDGGTMPRNKFNLTKLRGKHTSEDLKPKEEVQIE